MKRIKKEPIEPRIKNIEAVLESALCGESIESFAIKNKKANRGKRLIIYLSGPIIVGHLVLDVLLHLGIF